MTYPNGNSRMEDDISIDDNNDDDDDDDDDDEYENEHQINLQDLWLERSYAYRSWKIQGEILSAVVRYRKRLSDEISDLTEENYVLLGEEIKILPLFVDLQEREVLAFGKQRECESLQSSAFIEYLDAVRCYKKFRRKVLNFEYVTENLMDEDLELNSNDLGFQLDNEATFENSKETDITVKFGFRNENVSSMKITLLYFGSSKKNYEYEEEKMNQTIRDNDEEISMDSQRKTTIISMVYDRGRSTY